VELSIGATRRSLQALTLLFTHSYMSVFATGQIYKGPLRGYCLPVLSCQSCPSAVTSCPVGLIQHYAVIGQFPLFLTGLLGLVGLLVGRMACGWLCPFGLFQDMFYGIKTRKVRLPGPIGLLRYPVLLVLVLLLPYLTGESWFSVLCPQGTLTSAIPWAIWNPSDPLTHLPLIQGSKLTTLFVVKLLVLGGFLVLFVVSKRPFCRGFCPLGLLLSFFNPVSLVRLEVSAACKGCNQCQRDCPVDHAVHEAPNAGACIRCLTCTRCAQVRLVARPLAVRAQIPEQTA